MYVRVLSAWLGLGVIVIGLFNVAKSRARSSDHPARSAISAATMPLAPGGVDGVDGVDGVGGVDGVEDSCGNGTPNQDALAVQSRSATRRSA